MMNRLELIEFQMNEAKSIGDVTELLSELLSGKYGIWDDGSLYLTKQRVDSINGLQIEIFSKEHAPPHFHVSGKGVDASFKISDCSLLNGKIGRRERDLIEWWFEKSRSILISTLIVRVRLIVMWERLNKTTPLVQASSLNPVTSSLLFTKPV